MDPHRAVVSRALGAGGQRGEWARSRALGNQPGHDLRVQHGAARRDVADRVRAELRRYGFDIRGDAGPIVPVMLGSEELALAFAGALEERGIYAPAVRPPSVPSGSCRLRISVRANHTDAEIDRLLLAMR